MNWEKAMRRVLHTVSSNRMEDDTSEAGFVLVAAMVVLLALTMFGVWAIRTSTLEIDIAGSMQRVEKEFNVAEGSIALEGGNLGFTTAAYYEIADPTKINHALVPPTEALFDPGGDTAAPVWTAAQQDNPAYQRTPGNWPMQNLLGNTTDDTFDYRYLVTYLYPDVPPKGYDAASFSGYKFRVQGQGVEGMVSSQIIEVGGIKVGVKASK